MKKIYLLAIAAGFTLSSCEDFLDSENYTEANTGNFPAVAKTSTRRWQPCMA